MTSPGPWSEARARCDADDTVTAIGAPLRAHLRAALDALDAVLALHPRLVTYPDMDDPTVEWITCAACPDEAFPCPTRRAIEGEPQ